LTHPPPSPIPLPLPEIIYGEGKTPEQLLAILHSMGGRRQAEGKAEADAAAAAQIIHTNPLERGSKTSAATATAAAAAPPPPSPPPKPAAHGVIVASRVSSEKYKALQALMKEEEGGREGGMEAYGSLEFLPVPRLLVLRAREKEGGREGGKAPSLGT